MCYNLRGYPDRCQEPPTLHRTLSLACLCLLLAPLSQSPCAPAARPAAGSAGRSPQAATGTGATATRRTVTPARPAGAAAKPHVPRPPLLPARYRGYTLTRRNARLREKVIALTFDDGPNPAITPLVLQSLRRYNARATFFVLGQWAQEWPDLVRRTAAAGHAVESHSYSHPNEPLSMAHARRELERTEIVIEQLAGARPQLFRPPFGKVDGSLSRVAARLGYCVTKWTICGSDKPNETVSDIVQRVTQHPVSGDIVLLHDGRSHIATVKALPEVLRRLKAQGFTFVTVPRLLQLWDARKPALPAAPHQRGSRPRPAARGTV